jgi:hypothetical protein
MVAILRCVLAPIISAHFSKSFIEHLDMHVIAYSDILFRQQLIYRRAEIIGVIDSNVRDIPLSSISSNGKRFTEFEFFVVCKKCNSPLNQCDQVCSACKSFQSYHICTLCRLPVRGIGINCVNCGHGGHIDHVKAWIVENSKCPVGCDCICKFE